MITARQNIVAKASDKWPSWCQDRPVDNTVINPDQPLCTIRAEGSDEAEVLALLDERSARLERTIVPASA